MKKREKTRQQIIEGGVVYVGALRPDRCQRSPLRKILRYNSATEQLWTFASCLLRWLAHFDTLSPNNNNNTRAIHWYRTRLASGATSKPSS